MMSSVPGPRRFLLVTGPSGAGRSSALNVLEDAGFEVVDNLPLRLLPALIESGDNDHHMALGIDVRNRDFTTERVFDALTCLASEPEQKTVEVLYLDCSTDVLLRRFSETRRRHPLAPDDRPADGIKREFKMLDALRARADILIDTSNLNVHQLRAEIEKWVVPQDAPRLTVSVQSFSYKRGLPHGADVVHDCRFLQNPHWLPELRELDGTDPRVVAHVQSDPTCAAFTDKVAELTLLLLPAYRKEGKAYFSIAFGCTGGQHRSVVIAQELALRLADAGWQVSIRHRELDLIA